MPHKILLPVDGSDNSARAVRFVAESASRTRDMEVHLLNVEPRGDDWMVGRMFKQEELAAMEREWASDVLAPMGEILQAAGIPFVTHMRRGEVAPAIAHLAEELGCDQIVMGTRGQSALGDLLMGSVATKVLHLAKIPVTLVK